LQPTSRRGRPSVPKGDRKRPHNLSISEAAWQSLEDQLHDLPVKTVSELVEKIGQGEIQLLILAPSPLGDIPICRRLKALVDEPVAVFGSVLAFVRRTCQQLQLPATDDQVYTVILQAITVVFYTGYTHPDELINNPSALIKRLCYIVLQAQADRQCPPIAIETVIPEIEDAHQIFAKIHHAFARLELAARSPDYKALQMKTMDGLTIKQISRIFKLQGLEVSKVQVSRMIKQGLVNFRELFYEEAIASLAEPLNNPMTEPLTKPLTEPLTEPLAESTTEANLRLEQARQYLHLALLPSLNPSEILQLQEILQATRQDAYLDFWLNEIDYYLCHRQTTSRTIDPDRTVRDRLYDGLDEHFQKKKKEIDRELAFCQTAAQIKQVLAAYAERELTTKLSIQELMES
jgi:hypothetical protein